MRAVCMCMCEYVQECVCVCAWVGIHGVYMDMRTHHPCMCLCVCTSVHACDYVGVCMCE